VNLGERNNLIKNQHYTFTYKDLQLFLEILHTSEKSWKI